MKQLLILIKLSFKFSRKYLPQYLFELIKPFVAAIIGVILFLTCFINPALALVSLLSIPCMCYAFWKGYLITYALIPCAHSFIKESSEPFKNFVINIKQKEGKIAKYVCFAAFFSVILYTPCIIYIIKIMPSIDLGEMLSTIQNYLKPIDNACLVNTLILAPFLNYFLCAFYYKEDKDNYFKLFFNCYRKLNLLGLALALIITIFSYKFIIIYIVLALFLNPLIYSINAFWYLSRVNQQK